MPGWMSIRGAANRLQGVMNPVCMVTAVLAAAREIRSAAEKESAVQYLCLIYEDELEWQKMPKSDAEKIIDEFSAYTNSVRKSGHYVGGNALQPTRTATTVRVRLGKVSTTDGPFAETKEQLGGYYLLQARDLNEAIQLAARIPGARLGAVEVRPVMEL
jgi:hypothetical protein